MSAKPDGGPAFKQLAFPLFRHTIDELGGQHTEIISEGMTIRDYFAAKIMQGFLANGAVMMAHAASVGSNLPELAYSYADAMLAERDK